MRAAPETWALGVQALVDQGLSEATARRFLGSLMREYEEQTVVEAIYASLGKADFRAYLRGVLKKKPKRKPINGQSLLAITEPPPAPIEKARAAIATARDLLKR